MHDPETTVMELRKLVADFVAERDWQQFHDPKNLAASILIEAAELMEHFQWLRSDQVGEAIKEERKLAEVREEAADVLAFLLSFANALNIDLSSSLCEKMRKNALKYPAETFRGRFR